MGSWRAVDGYHLANEIGVAQLLMEETFVNLGRSR